MSDFAIHAIGISKQYRIGANHPRRPHVIAQKSLDSGFASRFGKHKKTDGLDEDNRIWALRDVSFEVKEGEVLGVIGKNGSGKSTLLKILSGITLPTTGEVHLNGRVGSLLEVGTGFHPELTGRENIFLNGAILGLQRAEIKTRFDEIVAFAEVEQFIDTPVKRYSSGMYVRLAFAVAAHLEPEILLVDEVLAVGDIAFQKKCLGKMGNVVKEGRTVVFVSHSMAAIRNICSRALLLETGEIQQFGQTDVVIKRYLEALAIAFEPVVHLPDAQNEVGTGRCLRFFSSDGSPRAQFYLGEAWKIVLEFELFKPTDHVIAAVGLVSIESVPIVTYWSKPIDLTPGNYFVEFNCEVPLAACDVQFVVGLSSYERSFYYEQSLGRISVSCISDKGQPIRASGSGILFSVQKSEIRPMNNIATAVALPRTL